MEIARPPAGSDLPGAAGNGATGVADAGSAPGASWTVDGTLRGGALRLTLYAGDSVTLSRTLVLDPVAGTLSGPWPLGFGPAETEVLEGRASCRPAGPDGPAG
jgi:hypothetical protein